MKSILLISLSVIGMINLVGQKEKPEQKNNAEQSDTIIVSRPQFSDSSLLFHRFVCGAHWDCESSDGVIAKFDPINLNDFRKCRYFQEEVFQLDSTLEDGSEVVVYKSDIRTRKTYATFQKLSDTSAVYDELDENGEVIRRELLEFKTNQPLKTDTTIKLDSLGRKVIVRNIVEVN